MTKPIGKLIKQERERRKIGLVDLASRAGINQGALSRIENGKTKEPYYSTVLSIEKALGCDFRRGL